MSNTKKRKNIQINGKKQMDQQATGPVSDVKVKPSIENKSSDGKKSSGQGKSAPSIEKKLQALKKKLQALKKSCPLLKE